MEVLVQFVIMIGLLLAVMALISAVLSANAKPKGQDLEFLTSSAPGEKVLAYRVTNACLKDAEPNAIYNLAMGAMGADTGAEPALAFIKSMTGGLWVGGRTFLTTHRVVFMPNAMNRALHKQLSVVALKLGDVTSVVHRFGLATTIVDVVTPVGTLTVRGYKMRDFASAIDLAR